MSNTNFASIFLLLNIFQNIFGDSLFLGVFLSMSVFLYKDFWVYSSKYSFTGFQVLPASETSLPVVRLWCMPTSNGHSKAQYLQYAPSLTFELHYQLHFSDHVSEILFFFV